MQPAPGVSHIILTVSDLERSKRFYGDLLGFEVNTFDPHGNKFYIVACGLWIWFVTHDSTPLGDRFSEFRLGLDHLAFAAPDEAWLRAMAERLIAAGVETKGVETFSSGNPYCAFRDPDNIQLEYWLD